MSQPHDPHGHYPPPQPSPGGQPPAPQQHGAWQHGQQPQMGSWQDGTQPSQPQPQPPGRPDQPRYEPPKGRLTDVFTGVKYLLRGIGWVARHPGQWLFGLIPAVIVLVAYAIGLGLLAFNLDDVAAWVTPFADGWSEGLRDTVRVIAGIAVFGASAFVAVLTFTALTLLVGDPFYESIAVKVEESQGGAPPEPDEPLLTQIARAVKDAVLLGVIAVGFALVFFVCGFIPVIGQTVVPVVAACVSGYFLAGELSSVALERRGIHRRERFGLMKRQRPLVVGFGAATFVVFLIPLGAVLAMPGAVAGATLLVRERLAINPLVTEGGEDTPGYH